MLAYRACSRLRLAQKKALSLPKLNTTLTPPPPPERILELDELWSFSGSKQNPQCLEQSGTFRACSRVWLALRRTTRQIVGLAVGNRSERTCRALWSSVVWHYKKATCYSDFWQAYQNVIPSEQHHAVGKETGETAHIERFNNTLRQRAGPTGCRSAQDSAALSKTRPKTAGRMLTLKARESHELLVQTRNKASEDATKGRYPVRAGIESTLSQGSEPWG